MFDNDGLLLHTEPCWTLAQQEFFRSYGRTFDLADKQALVGTSPRTSAPILQRLLSGADSGERLSDQMYSPALTEIAAGASPRPGAVELVARLQSAGLPLAVASNAPRRHLLADCSGAGCSTRSMWCSGWMTCGIPARRPTSTCACERLRVAPARPWRPARPPL